MSRLVSYLNLALRFNQHLLRKAFTPGGGGRERFLASYGDEGLFPLDADQRARMPAFSGCIGCGLCDTACPTLAAAHRQLWAGPSDLASALHRSLPDFSLLGPQLALFAACGDCRACEQLCPQGVPLRELAAAISALAARARGRHP